jgi:hypothetical protein
MIPDIINGSFELGGAVINLMNVRQIFRDKQVKGVHWSPFVFFTAWGLWNLFYYPHLGQWFSLSAGILLVMVNIAFLYGLWRYYK